MRYLGSILILLGLATAALAQNPTRSAVRGTVVDTNGAVVLGAQVILKGQTSDPRILQTDRNGEFTFNNVAPGIYSVQVTKTGFAPYENAQVEISPGRTVNLSVTLGVTIEETSVTVEDESGASTEPEAAAGAIVLRDKDLEALPDDPAELEAALRALAGPASGPAGGEIFIDGFSGGRLPPADTIREIRINQNPFSSEFDRLGFGRIEILTKPGTDDFRGELDLEFEDESFNSRNPFAPNRAPFQIREIDGNFSGPLIKGRASFFVDAGIEDEESNAVINAFVLDPNLAVVPFSLAVVTPSREVEFSPRFDIKLNDNHTLSARYFFERSRAANSGVGGFDLPSRALSAHGSEHTIRLTETAVLSAKTINESRFQHIARSSRERAEDDSPTIRVLDAFTGGGANVGEAFVNERRTEFYNTTSIVSGRHIIKFGGRVRHISLKNSSPNNFAGTFTFTSIDQYRNTILDLPGEFPTQFTIAGGEPVASVSRTDIGIFIQDDWRIDPSLTISLGLRYERQTNISSNTDIAPRFAVAYAPGADGTNSPKTVFRGGFGIFYERFSENYTLQAKRFDGISQQQFIVTDPAILDGVVFTQGGVSNVPSIDSLIALPQTTRLVSPELRSPYTIQSAFGVERQLPYKSTVSASFIHARTRRLLRSRNINAPINGVRPFPNAGNIYQYESTGRFDQNQFVVNFRTNFIDGISLFANYSLAKAKSDSDGAGTFPANSFDLTGEYGDALLDIRHRFAIGGSFQGPFGIRLNPFVTFRSGAPFNITTGLDSNGDSLFAERPSFATDVNRQCNFGTPSNPDIGPCVVRTAFGDFDRQPIDGQTIIPRNFGRGPEFFVTNLRISKEFEFGGNGGSDSGQSSRGGGGGRRGGINDPFSRGGQRGAPDRDDDEALFNIEFSVFIRNVFNRTNRGTPVGNLGSPFFGRSLSSAGGFGFGGGGSSAGNRRIEFEIEFSF